MSDDLLEPGDFLYQTDQELFLVVMEERDESYLFSVHGWRDIGQERIKEYLEGHHGKLFTEDDFETVIDEEADEEIQESYERLNELFDEYAADFENVVPADEFTMEDHE